MPKTKTKILGIDASRYPVTDKITGVENYTKQVLDGILANSNILPYKEIRLYTRFFIHGLEGKNVTQKVIKCKRLWTRFGLSSELKRNPVDTLFVPSHVLPSNCPKKTFITIHGLEAKICPEAYSRFQRFYQDFSTKSAVKNAGKLICVSQSVAQDLQEFYACPSQKIAVVHNGFDARSIKGGRPKKDDQEILLESYGLKEKEKFVLNIGRIEPRKNQARLIAAFAKFHQEFPDYKLVLAGPESYCGKSILKEIAKNNLEDDVILLGHVPHNEVRYLLEAARIFAYPSLAEGFGIPLLEAFSCGTPVLTSNLSALPEIAGTAAVLVNPLSVDEISAGLKTLATDEILRAKLIKKGQAQTKKFSWSKCVKETLAILAK